MLSLSTYVSLQYIVVHCCVCVHADKDDTKRLHNPWLLGQVDFDRQIDRHDVVGVGWTESRKGRTVRSHR